jgi:ABC-type multidrug transport system ATPase subunit/pSer/pThr/pTyr-binding forkhead associated (FHA) protein
MKTCSACQTANADSNKFCQQCGRPMGGAAPPDATVLWSGGALPLHGRVGPVPAMPVEKLFAAKGRIVIGRAADCDVVLPHPMVSRYHALLERGPDGLRLSDLGSVNGVHVGGRRIAEPIPVREGDGVGIGPFLFTLRDGVIHSLDSSRSLRLEARGLEKEVPVGRGKRRKLLDGIDLVVHPGEFVTLLGPSGSGKSTLMDCLNGRRRATGGKVLANGEDFYRHFDNFRQSLGYVPQRDIVHTGLTVYRALLYTARLRLPTDTRGEELRHRVDSVIKEMELGPHRDTLIANLSGGQVKRVSLGAELLAKPCLLYIDEATSGLDAGTEARMMHLFRRLADDGRSILCITHSVDNVEQCHLVLVLARGKLVYYGPPAEAPKHFGVGRISDIYDRLSENPVEEWAERFRGCELYQEFVAKRLAEAPAAPEAAGPPRLAPALAESTGLPLRPTGEPRAERFRRLTAGLLLLRQTLTPALVQWRQFRVLTARYAELIGGDQRSLMLLLLQAPLVAVIVLIGFWNMPFNGVIGPFDAYVGKDGDLTPEGRKALEKWALEVRWEGKTHTLTGPEAFELYRQLPGRLPGAEGTAARLAEDYAPVEVQYRGEKFTLSADDVRAVRKDFERPNPRNTYTLVFMLVVVVMWFGCNNAAKEIVKEEAIYSRERAVNLGVAPYLASKFLVLSLVTLLHALLLMGIVYGVLELRARLLPGYSAPPPPFRLDYATQFGVLALLSMAGVAFGLLLSACVSSPDRANALLPYVLIPQLVLGGGFLPVRGGALEVLAITLSPVYWAYRAIHLGAGLLPENIPGRVDYPDALGLPCAALAVQTAVLLGLTYWSLRRKEA